MYIPSLQAPELTKRIENFIDSFIDFFIDLRKRILLVRTRVSSLFRKEVWILEAVDGDDKSHNAIMFVGKKPERHYISKLFFGENYTHRLLGERWLWQLLFPGRKIRKNCSFSVIQTSWQISSFCRLIRTFCLPTWVMGSVDLPPDFDTYLKKNKGVKNALRITNKAHFKIEVSSDPLLFDEFYHKMHQPYMYKRHGDCAIEEGYDRLKSRFLKNSEIVFVVKGSQRIAGCILCYKGEEAMAYRLGVRDGDYQWVKQGAISALYLNMIEHCCSKGLKKLSLGGSRPFLSDGVLVYKMRNWSMKINDYSKYFYFLLKPLKSNTFTHEFLGNNPFISLKKGKMVVDTFCEKNCTDIAAATEMKTKYTKKGIPQVYVHYYNNHRAKAMQ
jgi:GNAT acetyltransferase-like protein